MAQPPGAFLKGQLHAHTDGSADSDTAPAEAAAWYAAHGYDFVVFTDHNVVTETRAPSGLLLLRGVELTQNLPICDVLPEPRHGCLLHMNGLFVTPFHGTVPLVLPVGLHRVDVYGTELDAVRTLGGVAQLNHPNFRYAADLSVLLALADRGLTLLEIQNQAVDSANEGDAQHGSTEALWDAALVRGAKVFGTATDDAHHYADADRVRARGRIAYTGDRGFVMVRAVKDPEAIRAAVVAGDFYSSTGVLFGLLELSTASIDIEVWAERPPYTFEVIVGGGVVQTTGGTSLHVDPRLVSPDATSHHAVRVRVTDGKGCRAWTQPVFL